MQQTIPAFKLNVGRAILRDRVRNYVFLIVLIFLFSGCIFLSQINTR